MIKIETKLLTTIDILENIYEVLDQKQVPIEQHDEVISILDSLSKIMDDIDTVGYSIHELSKIIK